MILAVMYLLLQIWSVFFWEMNNIFSASMIAYVILWACCNQLRGSVKVMKIWVFYHQILRWFLLKIKYDPERRLCTSLSPEDTSEVWNCYYFEFFRKPATRNNILPYKLKETSLLKGYLSDWAKAIASCTFPPVESMKTLSLVWHGLHPGVLIGPFACLCLSWQNSWMLVSQRWGRRKCFIINAFQWKFCSNRAHMNDLWLFFSSNLFGVRLVGWVWVSVFKGRELERVRTGRLKR